MLKTGEADIGRISREAVKGALNAGLNVVTKESAAIIVFQPNMQWTSPAFSDIRFRKALNLAIDKEAIIKQIFAGLGKSVAAWPGPSIAVFGGDLTLKPYPYDPQEARRLVKEGGWEGHEFNVMSFSRAGCPELPLIIETIAGYWEKVGLKPKIRMTEWAVLFPRRPAPYYQSLWIGGTSKIRDPESITPSSMKSLRESKKA
jgi:dipeptide transport system substrate-binding protein